MTRLFLLIATVGLWPAQVWAAQFSRPYFKREATTALAPGRTSTRSSVTGMPEPETIRLKRLPVRQAVFVPWLPMVTPAFQAGQPLPVVRVLPPSPPRNPPPPILVGSPVNVVTPPISSIEIIEPLPPPLPEVIVTGATRLVYPGRRGPVVNDPVICGEGKVVIRHTATATFHLALARNGVALIEFPAADAFAIVHPGNPDWVAIDEASRQPHAPLVLRPGSAFVAGPAGTPPTALVVVQMRSGLICSLFIHPAPTVAQNANVVHVAYDPTEIVNVRRAAGFAAEPVGKKTETTAVPIPPTEPAVRRVRTVAAPQPDALERLLRETPNRAVPAGTSKTTRNGLELSVAEGPALDERTGSFVVFVRNGAARALRLLDAQPVLAVRTFGPRGELIQEEPVTDVRRLSEKETGLLEPGETRVFAVSFRIPVLGVRQRLALSVGHATAADEPVSAVIGGPVNEKKNERKGKE